jgi:hypothetical protein
VKERPTVQGSARLARRIAAGRLEAVGPLQGWRVKEVLPVEVSDAAKCSCEDSLSHDLAAQGCWIVRCQNAS